MLSRVSILSKEGAPVKVGALRHSLVLLLVLFLQIIIIQAQPSQQMLAHHVPTAVTKGQARPLGQIPAAQRMNVSIVLPVRNQSDLTSFLHRLYDPSSPDYHHFLSVKDFADRFGPTEDDYQKIRDFATASGFEVHGAAANRMTVSLAGSVAQVEKAFGVKMQRYQHPTEAREFFSPDREPTVPAGLSVHHISGLNNYSLPMSMVRRSPTGTSSTDVQGSGPGDNYMASDMRAAYYGGTALTGQGQALGLFQFDGYDIADVISAFNGAATLSTSGTDSVVNYTPPGSQTTYAIPVHNVLLDQATGAPAPGLSTSPADDAEQVLDIVQSIGMAPGLSQVRVYIGSTDADILSAIASENLANEVSISWGWAPDDPSVVDQFFEEMAAQGQSVFVASGDYGAYSPDSPYNFPAEDPWVTAVGGTSLTTNGAGGSYSAETAWNRSGGGVSPDSISIPSWQAGVANASNQASTTLRNIPDVAMEADFDNYNCNMGNCSGGWAGTSFASPRWAAFTALMNQQALAAGDTPVGFLNPSIYTTGQGSSYGSEFHDVDTGETNYEPGYGFYAVPGYDLATGWGSPAGQSLIDALAPASLDGFSLSATPAILTVDPASSGTSTISVGAFGGFTGSVNLSVSGMPSGVTASFSMPSTTNSSVLTVNAGISALSGWYRMTITGTSGGQTSAAYILLDIPSNAVAINSPTMPTSPSIAAIYKPGSSIPVQASMFGAVLGYSVQWAPGILPTSGWSSSGISISGAATPMINQTAATWDTSSITTAGYYTILLTANYASGPRTATTLIYLEPDLLSGNWPMWVQALAYYPAGVAPMTASDGSPYLVWNGNAKVGSALYLTPPDGSSLLTEPYTGYPTQFGPPVGSLDGGAGEEAIVGVEDSLDAFRADGTSFTLFTGTIEHGFVTSPAILKDIDKDGLPELISVENPISGGSALLHVLRQNGQELNRNFPISLERQPVFITAYPRVIVGDINGDGNQEIIAIAETGANQFTPLLFQSDGSPLAWTSATFSGYPSQMFLADLDQNGKLESVMLVTSNVGQATETIHVLQPDGTERNGWPQSITDLPGGDFGGLANIAIGDLKQDGSLQIVASCGFTVYVFNSDGTNFSNNWPFYWPQGSDGYSMVGPVVVADINGDGYPEILTMVVGGDQNPLATGASNSSVKIYPANAPINSSQSSAPVSIPMGSDKASKAPLATKGAVSSAPSLEMHGYLVGLDRNANVVKQWSLLGGNGQQPCAPGSITVGDFDRTGRTEIAVSYATVEETVSDYYFCGYAGIVTVLNSGSPFMPGANPWPMLNHDPQNTGTLSRQVVLPTFSVAPGTYTSAQAVGISDTTPGSVIYYTTDGSTPTTNSTPYSTPITVSATETIQAVAIASGYS
jgi:hypothetical protein